MRDPLTWSFPLMRVFGIVVRVHWMFPLVMAGMILRVGLRPIDQGGGLWIEACWVMGLLFVSVLLHEFGHCFGARMVEGDASEILMWPLGGLAFTDIPNTPKAHAITVAAGPAVNLLLCLFSGLALGWWSIRPPFNPWFDAFHCQLYGWDGQEVVQATALQLFLGRLFWVNWFLALLNLLLLGFPMDGGRLFQCALWPRLGYRQATLAAVTAGFITMLVVLFYAVVKEDTLFLCLGLFIYITCRQEYIRLESGEEGLFGYDFSQGYTSLERDQPTPGPRQRQPNFIQRWLQRRAARKQQRAQEEREAEERRMDELLEKVQREGLRALTDEERRFLNRVSNRYRNRQQ